MKDLHFPIPTAPMVASYCQQFDCNSNIAATDNAVRRVFDLWPANRHLDDVLPKVAILNALFATNIFAIFEAANHICRMDVDAGLAAGSYDLVEKIADMRLGGKQRRNYSFASKYCHWHRPGIYPIYDSYVEWLLWNYQKQQPFGEFRRPDLLAYPSFVAAYHRFLDCFDLRQFSLREIDKFLWLYGREEWNKWHHST